MLRRFFSSILLTLTLLPAPALASSFNVNKIISDDDMIDYSRMSAEGVQNFLDREGGILANYSTNDVDGVNKTAAEIIYSAAYRYRLNPQFLLVQLQKESSIVTSQSTTYLDWAMGFGVCDSCSKTDPSVAQYRGFATQVNAAANHLRNSYLADLAARNSTISGWGVGRTKTTLDGIAVTPGNQATAVLYTYTPWVGYHGGDSSVGGNSLFFDIIERFFPNRTSLILDYPNQTLLQDNITGSVYLLSNGRLRPITSLAALLSNFDPSRIISVDADAIDRYQQGDAISIPRYILIQAPSGGIYLIDSNYRRRGITSAELFHDLGYNPEEVLPVTEATLSTIPEGAPLTQADQYPLGALLQDNQSGAVSHLDSSGILHPIWSKAILDINFKGLPIYSVTAAELAKYNVGAPEKITDGTLLKSPDQNTIYVIDAGKKRPINSAEVINELGGFGKVITTTQQILDLYPTGEYLKLHKSKAVTTKKKNK